MTSTRTICGSLAPLAVLALLATLPAACSDRPGLVNGCSSDSDCGNPADWRCDEETAQCRCRTSAACKEGELCNVQGYCQVKVGCYETRDCPEGFFCDHAANVCLPDGRCVSDVNCPPGQLCDLSTQTCRAGCRVDGDCPLQQVCLCSAPATGEDVPCDCDAAAGDAGVAGCPVGRCVAGVCRDDSFCSWGEVCRVPAEGELPGCRSDFDPRTRPYCANCVGGPGEESCGRGANYCLFDTYTQSTFCGVDCSDGQACANGYSCQDVIVVWTRTACVSTEECMSPDHRTSLPCQVDEDCPNHGLCGHDPGAPVGFCYGRCTFAEGANMSFCACVADEDCAQDTCVAETQTCSISSKFCDPGGGGCTKTRCVDFGGEGGCLIGKNCAPLEGLTCADVRTGP